MPTQAKNKTAADVEGPAAESGNTGPLLDQRKSAWVSCKADVGKAGAFLCLDPAAGVAGDVTCVDAGYDILGMTRIGDD